MWLKGSQTLKSGSQSDETAFFVLIMKEPIWLAENDNVIKTGQSDLLFHYKNMAAVSSYIVPRTLESGRKIIVLERSGIAFLRAPREFRRITDVGKHASM